MKPRFLISILTYRMESGVERCIASVMEGGGNFKLCLTANGNDAVANFFGKLGDHPSDIQVFVNDTNCGFIEPNNRAMRYAQDHDFDYLVLLNDDATVPYGWLDAIENEFTRHPAAAIVGGRGVCRTIGNDFHGYYGHALEFIEGSCAAYSVPIWKKHFKSLFHPALEFAYGEDSTASLEVRRLGYSIHQANFEIVHHRGLTSQHVPRAKLSQAKNHQWALEHFKHYLKHRRWDYRIIVRRWHAIGDVLLVTPVLRKLYEENPLAQICVETAFPEIFDLNPCVALASKSIPREPTDMVIDLDMCSENAPMRHFVTSYARAAGVEIDPPYKLEIYWKDDPSGFDAWGRDKWVALHAGSSTWPAKEWRAEKWNALIEQLCNGGWSVALVGNGVLDGLAMAGIRRDYRVKTKTMNELAAVLSHCEFFIGIDSAPLHVAQAVGIPSIGLFGITSSRYILTAPNAIGLDADPLLYPRAGERHRVMGQTVVHESGECINSITIDRVMAAVEQLTEKAISI